MTTPIPKAPTTVEFEYLEFYNTIIQGVTIYTFYVKCNDYVPLPLDANVRSPSESSEPYKQMCITLLSEPHMFFFKNGGINVIASDVSINKSKSKATLVFEKNYGILNGGHTQRAIIDTNYSDFVDDTAIVRVEVLSWKGKSNDDIALIAAAKNLSTNVKLTSIANKRGYFDDLKKIIDPVYEKNIQWFENEELDGDKFTSTKLIAILTLFDLEYYSSTVHPTTSANGPGSVFKSWTKSYDEENPKLTKVYPLVNDILDFYEYVCSTFNKGLERGFTSRKQVKNVQNKNKTTTFTHIPLDYILPEQVLLPILASFRADLEEIDGQYQWIVDPKQLFDLLKKDLFKTVNSFLERNDINKMSKDPTIWDNLYMKVQIEVMNAKKS